MDAPRSAADPVLPLSVGDVVRLRKTHPCGGSEWRVVRVGADIGLVCTGCDRRILLDRRDAERSIVAFLSHATPVVDVSPT